MPIKRFTSLFAVTDCKIAKLTADPEGGAATYAASIDVPGIKTVAITGTIDSKTLRGDNQLLDRRNILTDVSVAVTNAKLSMDVLQILLGGTITDAGLTPNQTAEWGLDADSVSSYFRLQAISLGGDLIGANQRFSLNKLMLTSFPDMGLAEEDYMMTGFEAGAVPPLSVPRRWLSFLHSETAVALT